MTLPLSLIFAQMERNPQQSRCQTLFHGSVEIHARDAQGVVPFHGVQTGPVIQYGKKEGALYLFSHVSQAVAGEGSLLLEQLDRRKKDIPGPIPGNTVWSPFPNCG